MTLYSLNTHNLFELSSQHLHVRSSSHGSIKPIDRQYSSVDNPNPGHYFGSMGLLAGSHVVWVNWTPTYVAFLVKRLIQDEPLFIAEKYSFELFSGERQPKGASVGANNYDINITIYF